MSEMSNAWQSALRAGIVLLTVVAVAPPVLAGSTVKVESKNMGRAYKKTSTRGGVRLQRQLSREACVEGVSWGFDRDGIWVDKGCRAVFEVGGSSLGSYSGGRNVKVESKNMGRAYKKTSTRGGVRLRRQLSREACVEGVSWGFDRDGIWVDKGCRAEFSVGGTAPVGGLFTKTVKVESRDQKRVYKRVSTRGGVRLVRQLSRDACVEGVSWGFDRDGIWVDKGCRAEFQIGG
jgi:hypothetical protein